MKNVYLLLGLILLATSSFAENSKVAPDLQRVDPGSTVQVIVQFDQDPTPAHHAKVLSRGGAWLATLHSVKAGAYSMPASAVADLANDPSVVHISVDHKVAAKTNIPPTPIWYAAATVNAPAAWSAGHDGTGVGVAVIDSGITNIADLAPEPQAQPRWTVFQDFLGGGGQDQYGHGTHVAGIIAGNGTQSICGPCTLTFMGIAPNANLVNLRVLDQNGQTTVSTVIAAIEAAIQNKTTYNIRVINLSLGGPVLESYTVDPLCQAVEAAWKAGIVVVVAAGNDGRANSVGEHGYGTITSPGNDPYVITVGAMKDEGTYTRTDDLIASYSSKGPTLFDNIVKPDLVAPGNMVVSIMAPGNITLAPQSSPNLIPMGLYQSAGSPTNPSNQYFMLSGTSMAAAVVSGAVADLLEAQPTLTPDQVKARLMKTASKTFPQSSVATDPVTGISYVSYYDIFTVGAGYLDLNAALNSNYVSQGTSLSPTATFNATAGTIYLNFNPSSVWASGGVTGTSAVWGNSAVWGTSGVWGSSAIWGTSAVWGTSGVWGTSAIWGTSGVWGSSAIWGTSSIWASSTTSATSITIHGEK